MTELETYSLKCFNFKISQGIWKASAYKKSIIFSVIYLFILMKFVHFFFVWKFTYMGPYHQKGMEKLKAVWS